MKYMYLTLKFEQGIEATALLWSFYNDKWKGKVKKKNGISISSIA